MKLKTQILIGPILILLIISIVTFINFYKINKLLDSQNKNIDIHNQISNAHHLSKDIISLETGLRGYVISKNEEFLSPYKNSNYKKTLNKFNANDEEIILIQKEIQDWVEQVAEPEIYLVKNNQDEELTALVKSGLGKSKTDNIRNYLNQFIQKKESLLYKQKKESEKYAFNLIFVTFFGLGLTLIVGLSSSFIITYIVFNQVGGEPKEIAEITSHIAQGNYKILIKSKPRGILKSVVKLMQNLKNNKNKIEDQNNKLKEINESLEKRIKERTIQLENSNKELSQFAYVASHDLKAPLRAINNLTTWIQEDIAEGEDVSEKTKMLQSRIKRMESLINGLLELSRIGRMHTEKENVYLKTIIQDLEELHQIKIETNELPTILINPIRIEQIFSNLIDNAVKYHHDKPNIKIGVLYKDLKDFYEFTIWDNGPGISSTYHEKIFNVFQTLHVKDKFESTGIGLSLVKKIVEEYGGTIRVESEEGKGAKFIFTINKYSEGANYD
jgi:signal transduction histidine kinase